MNHASEFWNSTDRYHGLARRYEQNITVAHPPFVTGRTGCGLCYHCQWCATGVKYYEYEGEAL